MGSKVSEKIHPPPPPKIYPLLRTLFCLLKSSSSFKGHLESHSRKSSGWIPILVIGAFCEVQVPMTMSPRFQCGGDGGVFVVGFATPSGSPLMQLSVLQLNSVLMLSLWGEPGVREGIRSHRLRAQFYKTTPSSHLFSIFHLFTHLENTVSRLEFRTFWI